MGHPLDEHHDPQNPKGRYCRHLLLHDKRLHRVLLMLLILDGLICLTCGVLETQYLHGKADECVTYVDTCMPKNHHRRLEGSVRFWLGAESEDVPQNSRDLEDQKTLAVMNEDFLEAHRLKLEMDALRPDASVLRKLSADTGHSSVAALPSMCSGHPHFGNHDLHSAEVALAWISVSILVLFCLEQFAVIIELRSDYLKPMFILDFFVIISSLAIELFVQNMSVGGLLIVARTWRFARVGHGVVSGHEHVEEIEADDETFYGMADAWAKLPGKRWDEIAKKGLEAEADAGFMAPEEVEVAGQLGKCPELALRCLAWARAYNEHRHRKMSPPAAMMGIKMKINGVKV